LAKDMVEPQASVAKGAVERGLAHLDAGRFERALADFESAQDQDLNYLEAYGWAAAALSKLRRFDEALRMTDHALWLDQYSAWAWNRKGSVFFDMGDFAMAVECFHHALENDADFVPAKENLKRVEPLSKVNAAIIDAPQKPGPKRHAKK